MKVLVIGGSYFYGRVFVMQAVKEHEVTVVNRGTYSMAALGVTQITGDRREEKTWREIKDDYDVIVDFCAYEKGDIAGVLRNMPGRVKQYIFISTVDVYERRDSGTVIDENTPYETRLFSGEAGKYIAGKVSLEQEVRQECAKRDIGCTVLRPAILYGPFNYAPRESVYIRMMVQNHVLPHIKDAEGVFQMLYVKDGADAILRCLLREETYGQAYNLCQEPPVTYDDLYRALGAASDEALQEIAVSAGEAEAMGIPLPFPVRAEESIVYSGEKSRQELRMRYLDFSEGMARTYRAFRGVYAQ